MSQRVVAVIPARIGSTRFPAKVLHPIAGKPMIQWVYERTSRAAVAEVLVATDDERVAACVRGFGGRPVLTSAHHPSGTDRVAEAVAGHDADWILNVQGDEPLVPPATLDALVAALAGHPRADMGTIAVPMADGDPDLADPNVVKVVVDAGDRALYFSRAAIPHARDGRPAAAAPLRHWGIYLFRAAFLRQFVSWPPGVLETCEKLEQLRALEHGAWIHVLRATGRSLAVDVPADVAKVEARLREEGLA